MSYDGKECTINPEYDEHCSKYIYDSRCSVCDFGYILENNECVKCTTDDSCAYCDPSDKNKCYLCSIGYTMNTSGGCEKSANFDESKLPTTFTYSNIIQ